MEQFHGNISILEVSLTEFTALVATVSSNVSYFSDDPILPDISSEAPSSGWEVSENCELISSGLCKDTL